MGAGGMTPANILDELRSRAIDVRACDSSIQCRPLAAVPPQVRAEITAHKAELGALLRAELVIEGLGVLAMLRERRIRLWLEPDGTPRVAPGELLDADDRALLAARREAVIAALAVDLEQARQAASLVLNDGAADESGAEACKLQSVSRTVSDVDGNVRNGDSACKLQSVSQTVQGVHDDARSVGDGTAAIGSGTGLKASSPDLADGGRAWRSGGHRSSAPVAGREMSHAATFGRPVADHVRGAFMPGSAWPAGPGVASNSSARPVPERSTTAGTAAVIAVDWRGQPVLVPSIDEGGPSGRFSRCSPAIDRGRGRKP